VKLATCFYHALKLRIREAIPANNYGSSRRKSELVQHSSAWCLSPDSSIGIATIYGLHLQRSMSSSHVRVKNLHFCRPAVRPTQTPVQWIRGAFSVGVKRLGLEADHSPPASAEVKKT
jgi:hypothetical protein